jgi:hypothetical protein
MKFTTFDFTALIEVVENTSRVRRVTMEHSRQKMGNTRTYVTSNGHAPSILNLN